MADENPTREGKRIGKNTRERERYAKSGKSKHNIRTVRDSTDDDENESVPTKGKVGRSSKHGSSTKRSRGTLFNSKIIMLN